MWWPLQRSLTSLRWVEGTKVKCESMIYLYLGHMLFWSIARMTVSTFQTTNLSLEHLFLCDTTASNSPKAIIIYSKLAVQYAHYESWLNLNWARKAQAVSSKMTSLVVLNMARRSPSAPHSHLRRTLLAIVTRLKERGVIVRGRHL